MQRVGSTMQNLRRVSENSDPTLSRLWTAVHEIFRRCRKPLVLSNALSQFSVSRFVQKIFAIESRSRRKTEQMQKFLPPIFVGVTPPTFLWHFVRATYYPLLGKVWLSPFADLRLRSLAMGECRIYGVGKNAGRVLSHLWTKFYEILE